MATGLSRQQKGSLQKFQLQGVRETGRTIGDGSYATAVELDFCGLKCVGKKIHRLLYDSANPLEKANMLGRFADECALLSQLHHPCIVQFLGVYFEQGSQLPVLVMEYLHTTLAACIDRYGIPPQEIGYGILRDAVLGLCYIHEHSPPIIHRDLSANNVLLATNMSAKISDLRVAKILNLSPTQMGLMTQMQTPGIPSYMPPEAMVARPKYTNKVDIFSYGVMIIHVLSGQWPIPGEVFRPDPANPSLIIPVSEIDRRAEYLQEIDQDHPLMGLIRQCLSNTPTSRPEAAEVFRQVETVISQLPPSLENRIEMIQRIQAQSENREIAGLRGEIEAKSLEIQVQRALIDVLRGERRNIETQRRVIDVQIAEIEVKSSTALAREVQSLRGENERQRRVTEPVRQQLERQSISFTKPASIKPHPLQPQTRLQWRRCADLPLDQAVDTTLVPVEEYGFVLEPAEVTATKKKVVKRKKRKLVVDTIKELTSNGIHSQSEGFKDIVQEKCFPPPTKKALLAKDRASCEQLFVRPSIPSLPANLGRLVSRNYSTNITGEVEDARPFDLDGPRGDFGLYGDMELPGGEGDTTRVIPRDASLDKDNAAGATLAE